MKVNKWQVPLQTASFLAAFTNWVILSSLMPFIKESIQLTTGQIALITAIPVILGSLLRIPVGYFTNRFGARIMFVISFLLLIVPVFYISISTTFIDLLIGGLLLGISGSVFSVGVTSLPKYFPKERHGFVNGLYGVGNIGTALTAFFAPLLANKFGWNLTVKLYIIILIAFALLNWFLGDKQEPKIKVSINEQLRSVYKDQKLWFLCIFYFITFGSFVALTMYLPSFLVAHFNLDKVDAGFRTAGFIILATLVRPVGGWMSDRWNPYKVLMFVFFGLTFAGVLLSFLPNMPLYTLGCLTIAFCGGVGNGAIFKLVPLYFSKQAGIANGLVAAMGGLGGFFPPIILTLLFTITGHYSIGFMALSEVALASLILVMWMYYQEKLQLAYNIVQNTSEGIMVTDTNGIIQSVNPAFTQVTGYSESEALNKTPQILKSGKHDQQFYSNLWESMKERGYWQGQIWNRRKNGEVYLEWLTISSIMNELGEATHYVAMFSDLTHHKKYNNDNENVG
ncbi:MAG TPA: MFS transporter [Bacillota bacterium]|nr:MFS transporter [Bacillota bacterium]